MSSENIMTNIPAQPVKNIEDMINWRTHVQNNYPLKQYMFFALSLDTGIAPGKLLQLTWNRIQTLLGPGVPRINENFSYKFHLMYLKKIVLSKFHRKMLKAYCNYEIITRLMCTCSKVNPVGPLNLSLGPGNM